MQRREFSKVLASGAAALALEAQVTERIKVGVITHEEGAHLGAYFPALGQTQEAASVVLAEPSGTRVKEARRGLGNKLTATYKDPLRMLEREKPAMALVSMEAALAPPAIEAALQAGCHVMAEKPACVRIKDFEELHRQATRADRYLMLALANRLNPEVRHARRLIKEGAIGKIYGLEMHLIADQTRLTRPEYHQTWRAHKSRAGGGHLIWLGIHWIDLAMYLTGSSITEVAGFAGNVGGQPLDVEDSAAVAMKFSNGTFGTLTSGYYLDRGYHSLIKIWGSHGWLEMQRHGGVPLRWYSTKEAAPKIRRLDDLKGPSGYGPFVRAAVRASAGLQKPPVSADDSLRVLKTVFACYRAAETGETQTIT